MKRLTLILLFFFILFPSLTAVHAYEVDKPNNKFGIHLAQPHLEDLDNAARLVNSNGGDWGYVTLVIQEDDRKKNKWQEIFDRLRKLHLIPIIRLATKPEGATWRRPSKEDASEWIEFLDSLNWVVKNRYVVLFNEPNHGSEWGGTVDTQSFAEVTAEFAKRFKDKNDDYVIMMAGMDASAPNAGDSIKDEYAFLQEVFKVVSKSRFEELFDAWASHSYPNPGFAGSPTGSGRGTVRTYQWERQILRSFGIQKNLPVFITETGWSDESVPRDTIASYMTQAYESVWLPDDEVVAVTPFVLDYQGSPFLSFSWKRFQSNLFYPQFDAVVSLSKAQGNPSQTEKGKIWLDLPQKLVAQSSYHFLVHLENEGQPIWDRDAGYTLRLENFQTGMYFFSDIKTIAPYERRDVDLYLKTNNNPGLAKTAISLYRLDKQILTTEAWNYEVLPLPDLSFAVSLYPKVKNNGHDFSIQIFNDQDELVFRRDNLGVQNGKGTIPQIQNIVLDRRYRIVLLKPHYLPRQEFMTFKAEKNNIQFKELLPFDFNKNGTFDIGDLTALLGNPSLFLLFVP